MFSLIELLHFEPVSKLMDVNSFFNYLPSKGKRMFELIQLILKYEVKSSTSHVVQKEACLKVI